MLPAASLDPFLNDYATVKGFDLSSIGKHLALTVSVSHNNPSKDEYGSFPVSISKQYGMHSVSILPG